MKKITEYVVQAFLNGEKVKRGNTRTNGEGLYLYGHRIAWKEDGAVHISSCGYETVTTKERLNRLLDMLDRPRIYQKNFEWYREGGRDFIDGMQA